MSVNAKMRAKESLAGNWGKAILIFLIPFAANFVIGMLQNVLSNIFNLMNPFYMLTNIENITNPDFLNNFDYGYFINFYIIAGITSVVSLFLMSAVKMGSFDWYMKLANKDVKSVLYVFSWYESAKKFFRSIGIIVLKRLVIFLWMLPAVILMAFATTGLIIFSQRETVMMTAISMAVIALLSFGLIAYSFYLEARFFAVEYLYVINPDNGMLNAIRYSSKIAKGRIGSIVYYELSFIGWYFLTFFTCGLLAFYVVPYRQSADTHMVRMLIGDYETNKNLMGNI